MVLYMQDRHFRYLTFMHRFMYKNKCPQKTGPYARWYHCNVYFRFFMYTYMRGELSPHLIFSAFLFVCGYRLIGQQVSLQNAA